MLLNESSVEQLFCPICSEGHYDMKQHRVLDNGWVLELNMDIIKSHSSTFGMDADSITVDWIFHRFSPVATVIIGYPTAASKAFKGG